jgi:DNA-binding PadR family transcriptional regulator
MANVSRLEYALLGLLQQNPQSGYDLRKVFAMTPMRHFSDSPGSIYPALRRLEARGWITGKGEQANARKRNVYRPLAAGKRAFVEWLVGTIMRDDVLYRLDELMLRFAFLDGNVEREKTLTFLDELEAGLDSYVKELRLFYKKFGAGIGQETGQLAFESGIQSYEASLNWARSARKRLERQS